MLKKYRNRIILTSIIIILPVFIGLFTWSSLPDSVATHFNAAGEADGWSSKAFAVLGLPFMLLGIHLLCLLATFADPKRQNISEKIFGLVMWICPVVSLLGSAMTYGSAFGIDMNVEFIMPIFVGLMFVIIGNYLPKCKQNYTAGIKIPWTLNDTENWNHTHRFAGKLWTIGGIIFTLTALIGKAVLGFFVLIPMAIAPVVYSYLFYRKKQAK